MSPASWERPWTSPRRSPCSPKPSRSSPS
jgi:hypothetical protein